MSRRNMMAGKVAKEVKYGKLYNYYVIEGTGDYSIIPLAMANAGWVVNTGLLSNRDIATLANYNGGSMATLGARIKETGNTYWIGNVGALNTYNFNARGAGFRQYNDGAFSSLQYTLRIWEYYAPQPYYFQLTNSSVSGGYDDATGKKSMGCSIRLVRPATTQEQALPDGTFCTPYIGNDGTVYQTIKVGTQVWLASNLAETMLRNGTVIPEITDNSAWATTTTRARCAYGNDHSNVYEAATIDQDDENIQFGDIDLSTGDIVMGEATLQHQRDMILTAKGEMKHAPDRGVGVETYFNDEQPEDMLREIRQQLIKDGMKVKSIGMEGQNVKLDGYYEADFSK